MENKIIIVLIVLLASLVSLAARNVGLSLVFFVVLFLMILPNPPKKKETRADPMTDELNEWLYKNTGG